MKTAYTFCGKPVTIEYDSVYRDNKWIGHLYVDKNGDKHVFGPDNKGPLIKVS